VKDSASSIDSLEAVLFSRRQILPMENILFAAPTPAVWLLSGIGLIVCNLFSRRLSAARYRAPERFFKMFLAMVTFVFFFYSTTFAISLLYVLDSTFLNF
jgi:hypothetical protein